MIMYNREHAPNELKLRFHIRNKRGEDITGSLRFDPQTGRGYRKAPDGTEKEYFARGGYVEINGHVNPLPEELAAIYANVRAGLSPEITNETVRKVIEDQRKRERELLTEQPPTE